MRPPKALIFTILLVSITGFGVLIWPTIYKYHDVEMVCFESDTTAKAADILYPIDRLSGRNGITSISLLRIRTHRLTGLTDQFDKGQWIPYEIHKRQIGRCTFRIIE